MGRYAVVISTTTKAREFRFDDLDAARDSANDLWRWARQNGERGTITLYEGDEAGGWRMVTHVEV
jgi:hypothetical protein